MSETQTQTKAELPANATIEQKLDFFFKPGKNPKFKQTSWPTFAEHFPELAAKLLKKDSLDNDVPNADRDENGRTKVTVTEHGKKFGVNMREDEVYGVMYSVWMMDFGSGAGGGSKFKSYRLTNIFGGTPSQVASFLEVHKNEIWKYKESLYVPQREDIVSVIVREEAIN